MAQTLRRGRARLAAVGGRSATAWPSPATARRSAHSSACCCTAWTWTRSARSPRPSRNRVFMLYQMTFAVITVALVAGSVADRMRFSAFLWFVVRLAVARLCAARALGVGRRLPAARRACSISPAAPSCISTPASPDWSPRYRARHAARLRHRQSRALRSVAGGDRHRPALGRLVRLQRRLGARRRFARRLRDRRDASRGLRRRADLDGCWSGATAASRRCSA